MPAFSDIFSRFSWRPIPGCPGRYVLRGGPSPLRLREILSATDPATGSEHTPLPDIRVFPSSRAEDPVHVVRLADGGIISFRKADGRYIHTLNTEDGFRRKLVMLGLEL